MQHAKLNYLSEADYLRGEQDGTLWHEYVAGQVFAMAGASKSYNAISLNIAGRIRSHLRGSPCRTYMADMKVRIEHADGVSHYYPDVAVTCSQQDNNPSAPAHYLIEPSLIVEVLSPGTEAIDRREKLLAYAPLAQPQGIPAGRQPKPASGNLS